MKTKIKTKLIRMNLLVILPILALVLLLTVFTIDRYQLENTKKTLLYDSYLLQVYLNQYLTISRKDLLSEKEIYFLNHDLSRMVKLRTQTLYLRGEVYVDSGQDGSAADRGVFLQDQGVKLALENQKNYTIIKMDRHRSFLINFPFYCDGPSWRDATHLSLGRRGYFSESSLHCPVHDWPLCSAGAWQITRLFHRADCDPPNQTAVRGPNLCGRPVNRGPPNQQR